jgi:hypothetical protein
MVDNRVSDGRRQGLQGVQASRMSAAMVAAGAIAPLVAFT